MKAKMPTQRAMPQKGASPVAGSNGAVLNDRYIVIRAATVPNTQAMKILPKAALSPPAAKNRPHEMNAIGRIRWKFSGTPKSPRTLSCCVTQWNVKFRENSVQRKDRTPMTIARGAIAFMRALIERLLLLREVRGTRRREKKTCDGGATTEETANRALRAASLRPQKCSWQPLHVLFP